MSHISKIIFISKKTPESFGWSVVCYIQVYTIVAFQITAYETAKVTAALQLGLKDRPVITYNLICVYNIY